jgi:hypothetical protein
MSVEGVMQIVFYAGLAVLFVAVAVVQVGNRMHR